MSVQYLITYSKAAIVEPAQPLDDRGISNSIESAWTFKVVAAAASDVPSCSVVSL
jgi:hypothetical protein